MATPPSPAGATQVRHARKHLSRQMDRGLHALASWADALSTENARLKSWLRCRLDELVPQWVEALAELDDQVELAKLAPPLDDDDDDDDDDEALDPLRDEDLERVQEALDQARSGPGTH